MRSVLAFLLTACLVTACNVESTMDEFQPGQVWEYETRAGEEASRLTICRIEDKDGHTVVHIYVDGLALKSPHSPDGVGRFIGHMPFREDAVRGSVRKLVETRPELPDFEEGYETWKANNGGVFTTSVAEGIDFVEEAVNR